MNRKLIGLLILLILSVSALMGCFKKDDGVESDSKENGNIIKMQEDNNQVNIMPKEMADDFKIIFTYGYIIANQHDGIDSVKRTIQKDLVLDGLAIGYIHINQEMLEEFYSALVEVNITSYPNDFRPLYKDNPEKDTERTVEPSMVYNLWISFGGIEYELYWHDSNLSETKEANELRTALEKIIKIIRSTEEYKNFGIGDGGYD